jgi:hypothetical protein
LRFCGVCVGPMRKAVKRKQKSSCALDGDSCVLGLGSFEMEKEHEP